MQLQSTSSGFSVLLCTAIIQPPMENSSLFENRVSGLGLERLKKYSQKMTVRVTNFWYEPCLAGAVQEEGGRKGIGAHTFFTASELAWETLCALLSLDIMVQVKS